VAVVLALRQHDVCSMRRRLLWGVVPVQLCAAALNARRLRQNCNWKLRGQCRQGEGATEDRNGDLHKTGCMRCAAASRSSGCSRRRWTARAPLCARRPAEHSHFTMPLLMARGNATGRWLEAARHISREQHCSNVERVLMCDLRPLEFPGMEKFRSECHHKPLLCSR
jgi:hypothetical protein